MAVTLIAGAMPPAQLHAPRRLLVPLASVDLFHDAMHVFSVTKALLLVRKAGWLVRTESRLLQHVVSTCD
jgi:hypothetical protein